MKRIAYINLYSDKNEELVKFYRDTLGLNPRPDQSDSDGWYGFDTGVTFAIEPERNRESYKNTGVNLGNKMLIQFHAESAEELEATNVKLESKGVKLINRSTKTKYGLITNFMDPDSNLVEILYPAESDAKA